ASVVTVLRRRAGQRAGHVTKEAAVAAPVAPQRLAVDVVPLRPAGRKAADLIAAEPDVPRLGDQLDVGENRVLADRGEERTVWIKRRGAAERRGQIEAEAVDVEHLDPVTQRVHDHLQYARMRELQRIAGPG